jgi:plasmid stabilization system protein ParE
MPRLTNATIDECHGLTLKWSEAALRDMVRLHRFLSAKSSAAASRAVATVREGVRMLAMHPEIGRPVEEMAPEFREWVIEFGQGAYVALYHYDGREVVIVAVRHGREAGY